MTLDLTRIQAVCFDIDGTLRDTDDQMVERLSRWLGPIRWLFHDGETHILARRIIMALESPANSLFGVPDRLGIDDALIAFGDFLATKVLFRPSRPTVLIPGARTVLEQLHSYYPLAVVSARGERKTRAFLEEHHIDHLFTCVATGQTCKRNKPHPDPILWAAAQMGIPPQGCLMVGDTTVDIRAGRAAGAQTVGVLCGFGEEAELRQAGADLVLPDLQDLLKILVFDGPITYGDKLVE